MKHRMSSPRWAKRTGHTLRHASCMMAMLAFFILPLLWERCFFPCRLFSGAIALAEPQGTDEAVMAIPWPGSLAQLKTIVIDPGHGGQDAGAIGPTGLQEKEVTLKVAKALKRLLQSGLGSRVFLTREGDSPLLQEERAGVANNFKADLFITIHASASLDKGMAGLEIYLPADTGEASEASPARASGDGSRVRGAVAWESANIKFLPLMRLLGRSVQLGLSQEMGQEVTMLELPMVTLKGVNMPSLHLEVGYITNASVETELKSDAYIGRLVAAIYTGIKRYKEAIYQAPAGGLQETGGR